MLLATVANQLVHFNTLKERMSLIHIGRIKREIKIQEQELERLNLISDNFKANGNNFKRKFYKFILANKLASKRFLLDNVQNARKVAYKKVRSMIYEVRIKIKKLNDELELMEQKLKRIRHKLEKFSTIHELIDDDFVGAI